MMRLMNDDVDQLIKTIDDFAAIYGNAFTVQVLQSVAVDMWTDLEEEKNNDIR